MAGFYDRFRNRLIFPIRDRDGAVVGFGARAMGDDQPKYLNSAQSSLFDKSRILYGLDLARDAIRDEDRVVIVEGYMDVIAAHQFGHRNVVATMGTAVTESQIELVKRMTKRIVLALDSDAAGQMAALRTIESIHTGLDQTEEFVPDPRTAFRIARRIDTEITVAEMPVGKDPDELIRTSPELWNDVIDSARPYAEFLITKVTEDVDLIDPTAKRHAVDRLAPVLQLVPDELTRSHYAQLVARRLDLPFREVQARLQRTRLASCAYRASSAVPAEPDRVSAIQIEDHLIALLVETPTPRFRPDVRSTTGRCDGCTQSLPARGRCVTLRYPTTILDRDFESNRSIPCSLPITPNGLLEIHRESPEPASGRSARRSLADADAPGTGALRHALISSTQRDRVGGNVARCGALAGVAGAIRSAFDTA